MLDRAKATTKAIISETYQASGPHGPTGSSATRFDLSQLTAEEKITYRKWKKAVLIIYSAVALVVAGSLIAIDPIDSSSGAKSYSTLAHR